MKRFIRIAGIVVVLLLAVAIALPFLIDGNQFRPALESRLTTALGRDVTLGNLKLSLFSGGVAASDVSIAEDAAFGKTPFLHAQSLNVGVEMLPLILQRKLNVTAITINQPQISLIETPGGVFNFSNIGAQSAAPRTSAPQSPTPDLSIALIKIVDGRITVEKTGSKSKPLVVDKLNLEVKNFAADARFPVSLTASLSGPGSIKIDGTAGPISAGAAADTPFNAKLSVAHLDLTGSGLVDPSAGISGIASIDGAADSAGGGINFTGKLDIEQLILAKGGAPAKRPVDVDLDLQHDLAKQSGDVRKMTIHLGRATATLSGMYLLATEPATVNLKLTGSKMPLTELVTFLPSLNLSLPAGASIDQGTADLNMASEGPLDKLVTQGTIDLENARLANYDFASKLQVLHEFTAIKSQPHTMIQTLRANLKTTPQGTALDNIHLVIASIGTVSGSGTISPAHALDFKMRVATGGGELASLVGNGGIPFLIQGTAASPSVIPDVRGIVNQRLQNLTGGKTPIDAGGLLQGLFGGKKKQK